MPWQIDTSHSTIGFSVKHMMIATVRGEFKAYTGSLDIDTNDVTKSVLTGEIDISSIDTRDAKRDEHLLSADFFDAETHPKMTFKSTRIEQVKGNDYRIIGDLTIRGTTKEIVLDAEFAGVHKDPWGNTRTGFTVTATLDRKDFGLSWNAALETGGVLVGEKVKLALDIEAVLQEAAVPAV